jgi:LysR family glycine cleavage system transcriptional activator
MPLKRIPSLHGLRAFEAAARLLSFTEAGRELHVSQAAISRHVRELERDLDCPLFRRLHRRVELTPPGQRLLTDLTAGFTQIYGAVERVRGISPQRLRITVEPAFAARWLVPRLGDFSTAHPNIELELEASDALREIGREADVAIRFLSPKARRPRGQARRLFSLDGFPVIAKARLGRTRTDAEVLGYRLLHDDDGTAWQSWFAAAGILGYDEAKHLHFNDSSLVLTAAVQGQGVALSAPIYVGADLKHGRLMRIGRTHVIFGDYWLLQATGRGPARRAREAFVDWLENEIQHL